MPKTKLSDTQSEIESNVAKGSKTLGLSTASAKVILLALLVLFLGAAIAAGYFYKELRSLKEDPKKVTQKEVDEIIKKVGELMVLPANEEPSVATVSDPEKLKDQEFFANAKLGDKVLIYAKAKKAILYDPKAHKILEVAPVNLGNNGPEQFPEEQIQAEEQPASNETEE